MIVQVWRGYHEWALLPRIEKAWHTDELLILCPPNLQDLSFLAALPFSSLQFLGDWPSSLVSSARELRPSPVSFASPPVLGVFTSGTSSGKPRLVLYSKENIQVSLQSIRHLFERHRLDRIFCYPQPFHTFGLLLGYVLSILEKIPLEIAEGKYGRAAHQRRLQLRSPGLLTLGTPTHFHDLCDYVLTSGQDIAPSYSCIIGGAPVTKTMWQNIHKNLRVAQPTIGYGCTEASPGVTHHPPGRCPQEDGEIGFPLEHWQYELVPNEGVKLQGPSLCLGIVEDGQLTFPKTVTIRDKVRVSADGMWIYEGRLDLLLNRGGQKFSLEFVEQVLYQELGLQTVAVPMADGRLGQDLAILVRKNSGAPSLWGQVRDVVQRQFGFQLNVAHYLEMSYLPLNESHKIDRRAVQLLFVNPSLLSAPLHA